MNERILKILNLCLTAKEMGHNVFFNYAPHVGSVGIYAYDSRYNYEPDEEADSIFRYDFYSCDTEEVINSTLDNMEITIQKLIDGEFE